jgi:chromosome segregation ATPase
MLEKHLKRIKKSASGITEDDEWEEIPTLGQKIEDILIEEIPDRTIEIKKDNKNNFEMYEKDALTLKDEFSNTAQYFKEIKKQLEDKKADFQRFKKDTERFDKEISILKPKKQEMKFDLNRLNYKEVKVDKLKQELDQLETERQEIKSNIIHFTNQIKQAQTEFDFKVKQIEDIKFELKRLEKKESLQQKIHTEQDAIDLIKQELGVMGDMKESNRIHRTVNTLVDLLNSKNQLTLNELNSVKDEFSKLQTKYIDLMNKLK